MAKIDFFSSLFINVRTDIYSELQLPGSPRQSFKLTNHKAERKQHFFFEPIKCRVQNNEISPCSIAVKTDRYKFWLFSANLTNLNHTICMVNRSNVSERKTPNCVKTGNARVARMSRPANKSGLRISNHFFALDKFCFTASTGVLVKPCGK